MAKGEPMKLVELDEAQFHRHSSPVENDHEATSKSGWSWSNETPGKFPHERLDAYQIALTMARNAKTLAQQIPRGHRSIADHLLRSSSNTVLLLAEGANRRSAAEKRQRFVESRGEASEAAAACDLVIALGLGSEDQAETVKGFAARVAAMLTGLIQRLG
jgi:four helix bundle protein